MPHVEVRQAHQLEFEFAQLNRANALQARRAGAVRGGEARWLTERILNDRLIRDNERALLAFIRQAASAIHPDLQPLLKKAGLTPARLGN